MIKKKCKYNGTQDCTECEFSMGTIFRGLTYHQRELLCDNVTQLEFSRKQNIFTEGGTPQWIFFIHKGKVKISVMGEHGKDQIVRMGREGDVIGYYSMLIGETYKTTATALSDVRLCGVTKSFFTTVLEQNTHVCRDIMGLLAKDLCGAENRMLSLSYKSVKGRIAESILSMSEVYGFMPDEKTIALPIYRKDLAEYAGVTIETAIRCLSELKDEGVLSIEQKNVVILDPRRLHEIAHS